MIAEQIPVHHIEGTSLGFLVLRDEGGTPIGYGDVQQVVTKNYVMNDMKLRFKDGSFYEEITKFRQRGVFRLLSNQVVQRGPSFKLQVESWIDATSGNVRVRSTEKGKEKDVTKHLDLPPDVANGMLSPIDSFNQYNETMHTVNDSQNEIFLQKDARNLVSFAKSVHLGMLSYWEQGRDANACNGALFRCTNVPQSPFEFGRIFAGFTG